MTNKNNLFVAIGKLVKSVVKAGKGYFGYRSYGWVNYPGKGMIWDEEIYNYLKKHSRFIDRINPRRMYEMSYLAFDAVTGSGEPGVAKKRDDWKFFPDALDTDLEKKKAEMEEDFAYYKSHPEELKY